MRIVFYTRLKAVIRLSSQWIKSTSLGISSVTWSCQGCLKKKSIALHDPGEVCDTLSTHKKQDFTLDHRMLITTPSRSVYLRSIFICFIYILETQMEDRIKQTDFSRHLLLPKNKAVDKRKWKSTLEYYFYFSCLIGLFEIYNTVMPHYILRDLKPKDRIWS